MSAPTEAYDVSVVIPTYNAETTIVPLVERLLEVFAPLGRLQVVLANDFSADQTHARCLALVEAHPDAVTYLRLARNFGEHNAVMAGLNHARGAHVVIMDDDFQNRPEDAVRLVETARAGGYDVVYTSYPKKQHSWVRNLGSAFNDRVANWMLKKPRDLYLSSFKCLNRWAVDQATAYRGPYPYVDGLVLRATRNIGVLEVEHQARSAGRSGYTWRKLIGLWLNAFVNFSLLPLRFSTLLGFAVVACGIVLSIWILIERLVDPRLPSGWAFLALAVTYFSGAQLLILGIFGEYLGRLFLSSNHTPQYAIRECRGAGAGDEAELQLDTWRAGSGHGRAGVHR